MESKKHWERIYNTRPATEVSWFQVHAQVSLKFIQKTGLPTSAPIIDVGGGASTLVDDLLDRGYENITVLDLSGTALATTKNRLGARARNVSWLEVDVLQADLPVHKFQIWHDRAVFHFLTHPDERQTYVQQMLRAVDPGGFFIIATFAKDGPTRCSGLPTMRYNADELLAEFGQQFQLLSSETEAHVTPGGTQQKFNYCLFRRSQP